MRYLIDTYNLVHAAANQGGPLTGFTVRKLCQYIVGSPTAIKATLVLDGRPKPDEPWENEFPDINLVYSGAGVSADAVIAQTIERAAPPRKKLTVVSDDRAVILHARKNYAHVLSCDQFLQLLTEHNPRAALDAMPPKKVTGKSTAGEADHWLKEFGFENAPAPPPPPKNNDPLDDLNIEDLLGPRTP
jgi:hypothetical protein